MTPNKLRGEVVLSVDDDLGKTELLLRPTFDALVKIEQDLGTSFLAFVAGESAEGVTASRAAMVVHHCVVEPEGVTREDVGALMFRIGLAGFMTGPFQELLMRAGGFHEEAADDAKDPNDPK